LKGCFLWWTVIDAINSTSVGQDEKDERVGLKRDLEELLKEWKKR